MGKNLKGKECGKGICQRKDGLYVARFVDRSGKRREKYFKNLPEARNWMEEQRYADKHDGIFIPSETTVDEWFRYWITHQVGTFPRIPFAITGIAITEMFSLTSVG